MVEHRIKRGCLAAAGWAGGEDDAFRARNHQLEQVELVFGQAEAVERNQPFLTIQNAQDDVFAVDGRLGGNAKIDLPPAHAEGDATVLRRPRFGNVHAAQDLDAHGHGRPVRLVQRADLAQHAVDAVTDAQEAGLRFEVDVGGFAFDGVGQDRVDEPDDRLAVFVGRRLQAAKIDLAGFDLVQDAVDRELVTVGLVDGTVDLGFTGEQRVNLDVVGRQAADAVECDDIVDIGDGDRQSLLVGVIVKRQKVVALGQFARDQRQCRRVDDDVGEVDALLAETFRQRITQGGFGNEPQRNQQLADRLVQLHLLEQRDPQLVFAEDALGDQDLAELSGRRAGGGHRRVCVAVKGRGRSVQGCSSSARFRARAVSKETLRSVCAALTAIW